MSTYPRVNTTSYFVVQASRLHVSTAVENVQPGRPHDKNDLLIGTRHLVGGEDIWESIAEQANSVVIPTEEPKGPSGGICGDMSQRASDTFHRSLDSLRSLGMTV